MKKSQAIREISLISSGTIATITNERNYEKQDIIVGSYIELIESGLVNVGNCDTWVEIWANCECFGRLLETTQKELRKENIEKIEQAKNIVMDNKIMLVKHCKELMENYSNKIESVDFDKQNGNIRYLHVTFTNGCMITTRINIRSITNFQNMLEKENVPYQS